MRVLLVEDHPDTAAAMVRCLRALGHSTTVARTRAQAMALCRAQPFHAMFCDIMLPDGDGWPLAGLARQHGIIPIAVSAIATRDQIGSTDDSGFAAYLPKPVAFHALCDLLSRLLTEPGLADPGGEWVTLEEPNL